MNSIKTFIYCIIGTILEWYDFAIFGVMSPILAGIFFPQKDKVTALLITFSIFATGFIMRPLGGIFFGHIGDKHGRKKAIALSVLLMTIATVSIGLLPTGRNQSHSIIMILIILRLLQGFAVSGEYAGIVTFIGETSPKRRFFFFQSLIPCGAIIGMLLGSLAGSIALLNAKHHIHPYAWRIPFLISIFLGAFGLYLRMKAIESPVFKKIQQANTILPIPVKLAFSRFYKTIFLLCLLLAIDAIGFYFVTVYYPSYIYQFGKGYYQYLHIAMLGMIAILILSPLAGYLANQKNVMQFIQVGIISFIILPIPSLLWNAPKITWTNCDFHE